MKKTNYFMLFMFFFLVGTVLPNSIFSTPGVGFAARGVVLLAGLVMYTIALYHKTKNLMDLTFDGGISNVVHWIRAVSLIGLIITLITLGNLLSEGEIVSEEKAAWFFHFIFYFIIFETIFTLFAIFVFNDIEIKDKDANEKKEELKKLKSQLPGSGGFCN